MANKKKVVKKAKSHKPHKAHHDLMEHGGVAGPLGSPTPEETEPVVALQHDPNPPMVDGVRKPVHWEPPHVHLNVEHITHFSEVEQDGEEWKVSVWFSDEAHAQHFHDMIQHHLQVEPFKTEGDI